MKKCNYCNAEFDNKEYKVCPYCGEQKYQRYIGIIGPSLIFILFIIVSIILKSLFYKYIMLFILSFILMLTFYIIIQRFIRLKRFNLVYGKIVDFIDDIYEKTMYSVVVEYEYNGKTYRGMKNVPIRIAHNKEKYLNQEVYVFVNPKRPTDQIISFKNKHNPK